MLEVPGGTVTFLFTDVEGSTVKWDRHREAMRDALVRHDALLTEAFDEAGGYVFTTDGDAFCTAFSSALRAVEAALAAQRRLHHEDWSAVCGLRVRMAMHSGTALERDGDYFGPVLNRVARLLGIAHGGQILLSAPVFELVRDDLPDDAAVLDLGEHRLRDLNRAERAYQLGGADLPVEFPPLRSLDVFPHNLPIRLSRFVGREEELSEVKELMARSRLATLTGTGGCGKTRLALQVAADALSDFPDGVWFVDLAPLADSGLVPSTAAAVLGLSEEAGRSVRDTLFDYLRGRNLLLVLDNCEHLIDECAQLAGMIVAACPDVHVLATSREALNTEGELAMAVPTLDVPPPDGTGPGPEASVAITQYESVELFVDRAMAVVPDFAVTNDNAPAVAEICHRLDGIPLAIEMAAARVKTLPVAAILDRLDERLLLLAGGRRTALPRHRTLRATLGWSYDLLADGERLLFQALSVFRGGCTLSAAEVVCATTALAEHEILGALGQLVEKSLVTVDYDEADTRFDMLRTVQAFSREKLADSGSADAVRSRHLAYYLSLAEEAHRGMHGADQAACLQRLEADSDNLRAAVEWSAASGDADSGLRLGGSLWEFWVHRGHLSEGRDSLQRLLSVPAGDAPVAARADALDAAGILARHAGDLAAAERLHDESLSLRHSVDDPGGVATTLLNLGQVAKDRGERDEARRLFLEAEPVLREVGDRPGLAAALTVLGAVANEVGDNDAARAYYEESLAIRRELGDRAAVGSLLNNLSIVAWQQSEPEAARQLCEEGLAIHREMGNKPEESRALKNLAGICYAEGAPESAPGLIEESLKLDRDMGAMGNVAGGLCHLGYLYLALGDPDAAREHLEESLVLARELELPGHVAWSLNNLGRTMLVLGDAETATSYLSESLSLMERTGSTYGVGEVLEALADVAGTGGDVTRAARLYAASEAVLDRKSIQLPPPELERIASEIEALRGAAGDDDAFEKAWAEGAAMSDAEAVAYATGAA